jgi:asparagine synthase (glutamine-hydrolysing)
MCGILFTNKKNISSHRFSNALSLMSHRGPDFIDSLVLDDDIKLGHTRLSIIDINERSNQPFWSQNKKYVMVFNGEIYNHKDLAKKYKINTKTASDTEVLIELFVILGVEMLNHLNGMFSIVIYDIANQDFFVARDRLGIKPLYFFKKNNDIIISSEIAPILSLIDKVEFDDVGVRQYKKLRTFFNGHTLYSNIEMFGSGTYMFSGRKKTYWALPEQQQPPPTYDEIRWLIESSVNFRCLSDVPVGSYLSGGLDSTIIAGLSGKIDTWTIGFENSNEFEWARIASNKINSSHTSIITNNREYLDVARWMVNKRREPLSVPNEVLIYLMTKSARKKNTVILSGEGADELFYGYDRIFKWASRNEWDLKEFDKYYSYGAKDDLEIVEYALEPYLHHKNSIDIVGSFFQVAHLHGLLRRLDNSSMLCSVEARVPFVDHRLVERMSMVPYDFRIKDGISKYPLRQIFKDIVPKEIIERKKIGFPVPLDSIFSNKYKEESGMDAWLDFNLSILME